MINGNNEKSTIHSELTAVSNSLRKLYKALYTLKELQSDTLDIIAGNADEVLNPQPVEMCTEECIDSSASRIPNLQELIDMVQGDIIDIGGIIDSIVDVQLTMKNRVG